MNRIKAGSVLTRNPVNPAQWKRVELSPGSVECFVFWTKDPANFMDRLDELEALGYKSYFQFTLTPYGRALEKNLRNKAEIENTLRSLGAKLGAHRVHWRYDPVILDEGMDIAWHAAGFDGMCGRLQGYVDGVTISFVNNYAKLKRKFKEIGAEEICKIAQAFGESARKHGLNIFTCCEKEDLSAFGIKKGSCIDKAALEKACGRPLTGLKPDKNQRPGCGCCRSIDIGVYNTCLNGCVYCYANYSGESVMRNMARHDPFGEEMLGDR